MLEEIIRYMSTVDPVWIYLILFFFSFIENVIPPAPSDVVVVAGSSLIASAGISFVPVLLITSIGSALGFILMYLVGLFFGEKILRTGKIKFIKQETLDKTDLWFKKYGYKLILTNRFLPGTRSVISFFSGITELNILRTFTFAAISAFVWNTLIIFLGMQVGNNVQQIDYYLSEYSRVITILSVVAVIVFTARFFLKKKAVKQ
ncbi:MAG: DedA family protein [Ignavibacteria bacterium]|nr:DedA family protein [Ignavibacteria bacterium]